MPEGDGRSISAEVSNCGCLSIVLCYNECDMEVERVFVDAKGRTDLVVYFDDDPFKGRSVDSDQIKLDT